MAKVFPLRMSDELREDLEVLTAIDFKNHTKQHGKLTAFIINELEQAVDKRALEILHYKRKDRK